jgi:glycosyltransferase involved in cell wall biosynthesis
MGPTPISVIIPVRNEGDRLINTVASLVSGRSCRFFIEFIIVDDASSDDACERLLRAVSGMPEVRVIVRRLDRWSGIPYARNRGAEAASYPIYLITDGNTRYPLQWDLPIRRWFQRNRILAGTIVDIASPFRGYGCTLRLPAMGAEWIPMAGAYGGYVPIAACTCTIIDQYLFHHLGGYDETLPLYGPAEPEFSVRAWLSGYEIINLPDLLVQHRFRPEREHAAFVSSIQATLLRNFLRFAYYYLPHELLERTYAHYTAVAPEVFNSCLAAILSDGAGNRRIELQQKLAFDFQWLARRFGLVS